MKKKFENFITKFPNNRMSNELSVILEEELPDEEWENEGAWYSMLDEIYSQNKYDGKLTTKEMTEWEKNFI